MEVQWTEGCGRYGDNGGLTAPHVFNLPRDSNELSRVKGDFISDMVCLVFVCVELLLFQI